MVRLVVTAIIIKLVDKLVSNFEIRGFWPALVIAIALAIAGTLVNRNEAEERYNTAFLPAVNRVIAQNF